MFELVEIRPSASELASGILNPQNLSAALRAIAEDGVVVLAGVISQESIRALRERSMEDTQLLISRPNAPYNWTKGNIQQDPPPFPPYLFRDVLVNDLVIQVTKGVLGAGLKSVYYSGNTAMPSDTRQPVHADEGQLWPGLETVPPPHALVVNVPLVDMGPENGSTEIWPQTHLDPSVSIQSGDIEVPLEKLETRRLACPPLQPTVQAGSVVIRDVRMWHAGMPNRTSVPRPMIAMIHVVSWWPSGKLLFAKGSEPYLDHPELQWCADFADREIDHISQVHGHMSEAATKLV